jgi:molybdopterin-guanine dinucleotide biosynthesis protein A
LAHERTAMRLQRQDLTGVVLAGGRGMRMGGADKGLQLLDGDPLALHVLRRLAPQAGDLLISANRNLDEYRRLGEPFNASVVADTFADYPGPLAGLLAALKAARTEFVLTVPCDAPYLDEHLATRLADALVSNGADLACAVAIDAAGTRTLHPVFALVRASLADDLDAWLRAGERKVRAWYARHKAVEVPFVEERAFYNVNDLRQLAELGRR